jgi:hypothetical protein
MCVRALRITVLKSAGNFTRDECHDLSAEKIQHVKCFMFTRRNLLRPSNFRMPERRAGFENFRLWSIRGSGGYFALSGLPLDFGAKVESCIGPNFGEALKREAIDDSYSLSRATEVAYEFSVRR